MFNKITNFLKKDNSKLEQVNQVYSFDKNKNELIYNDQREKKIIKNVKSIEKISGEKENSNWIKIITTNDREFYVNEGKISTKEEYDKEQLFK